MNAVEKLKSEKRARWINHQLAQKNMVYFWPNNRLFIIKSVKQTKDGLIAINKYCKQKINNEELFATKADISNPVGTFKDKPLEVSEYVDLLCKCIW